MGKKTGYFRAEHSAKEDSGGRLRGGAGIAGLTAAKLLADEGKNVVVLDEGPVGGGQTSRTSAHLASALDDRFFEIERLLGSDAARIAYDSHARAIDMIEQLCTQEKIKCDFARVDGYLFASPDDGIEILDRELEAAKKAGAAVEKVKSVSLWGSKAEPCLRFANQARFHPMKYLNGLAKAVEKSGGKIYTGRRVKDVRGADAKKKTRARATLDGGSSVEANAIIVATNTPSPINDWMGIYSKQASYRSYVIGVILKRNAKDDALYWDSGDPYHYVRVARGRGHDVLIVGGEDHKTGQPPEHAAPFARLETWARKRFADLGQVKYRWSGQVQEPADGVAFIGRAPTKGENVYVITGDSGMGLTHGTLGAMLVRDLILVRNNPWETLYDPSRKMTNAEFVSENANTLKQYADLLTSGDVASVKEIRRGEGALVRDGLKKLAVWRDDKGTLHKCSALCTHLQCVVQWNGVEKTWDCPCHGSRFDPTGKVLMGPAIDDLAKVR